MEVESRPLQIGDIVTITSNHIRRQFTVDDIADTITISDGDDVYHLVGDGDEWTVSEWSTPHSITFGHTGLAGVNDVDLKILYDLYYEDILSLCVADPVIRSLCDNNFWVGKIRHDFGEFGIEIRKSMSRKSPKDVYQELINTPQYIIRVGRIDLLERIQEKITPEDIYSSIQYGDVNAIMWSRKILITRGIYTKVSDDEFLARQAANYERIDILELVLQWNPLYSTAAMDVALVFNRIGVVDWLYNKGDLFNITDYINDADHIDMIIYDAIERGSVSSIQWLETHGMVYTNEHADMAAKAGALDILKWFAVRGIYPTIEGWYRTVGYDEDHIDSMNYQVVKWMIEQRLVDDRTIQDTVNWLKGFVDAYTDEDEVYDSNEWYSLSRFIEMGYRPTV
jgi:hypothetical protein